jgi:hypothetical protein
MSALGHEQTSRHVRVMSVIPLKADIHQRGLHVCLVPRQDIGDRSSGASHSSAPRQISLFVELWGSAAYAFVGSSRGNIEAHSAGAILIQHKAAGHEVEG